MPENFRPRRPSPEPVYYYDYEYDAEDDISEDIPEPEEEDVKQNEIQDLIIIEKLQVKRRFSIMQNRLSMNFKEDLDFHGLFLAPKIL